MSVSVTARLVKDIAEIKVHVQHASEDGQRMDPATHKFVPAEFMQQLQIHADERLLVEANLGGDLANNPDFTFKARNLKAGAKISVDWIDSKGDKGSAETVLAH